MASQVANPDGETPADVIAERDEALRALRALGKAYRALQELHLLIVRG